VLTGISRSVNQYFKEYTPTQLILLAWVPPALIAISQRNISEDASWLGRNTLHILRKIPLISSLVQKVEQKIQHEIDKDFEPAMNEMDADIHKKRQIVYPKFPSKSINRKVLLAQLKKDCNSEKLADKMSGAIYRQDTELDAFNAKIFELGAYTNPLHSGAWPNVAQREAEVIAWCSQLYHGDETMCGTITGGGTFSIMEACRTYKEWALSEKSITKPNMVVPNTVHAAFDKAAKDYGIKLIKVPVDAMGQADVKAMAKKINSNTIALVGSAPSYPTGTVDPIEDLSNLALKHNIGLHVDACLGGFLIPFAKEAGYPLPPFDFSLKGVTSISLDPHKYGQTPKGSSVVLMRKQIGIHQPYVFLDSPIGMYVTPNQAGSRCGANILMTWGTLASIGRDKYIETTRKIIALRASIETKLKRIPELKILGTPRLSVIAFESPVFNIYLLSEKMKAKGWHLNNIQGPAGTHLCLTARHLEDPKFAEKLMKDLRACIANLKRYPNQKPKGEGAVYATLAKIPAVLAPHLKAKLGQEHHYLSTRVGPTRSVKIPTLVANVQLRKRK
jgi:sphinganine-1-phosphate aldolase